MTVASYTAFVARYPFLMANVATLALVALALLFVSPRRRRIALWSAVACLPGGVTVGVVESGYWRPVFASPAGLVENDLISFIAGALVGLLLPIRWPPGLRPRHRPWLRRYLPAVVAAFLLFGGLVLVEVPVFEATLWATVLWGVGLLAIRPRNTVPAMAAMAAFALLYGAIVWVQLLLWPEYIRHWGTSHPLAAPWLGVPAGEWIWAATCGFAWAALMLFVLEPEPVGGPAAPSADPRSSAHSASSSRK